MTLHFTDFGLLPAPVKNSIRKVVSMKLVKEKAPYSPTSPRFLGRIYTQAGGDNEWISLGKHQINEILDGHVTFTPSLRGGIGILQIGDCESDKIHCLEREYRSDWQKIIRRIFELSDCGDDEKFIQFVIKRQPIAYLSQPTDSRPTHEQLLTDPRYNNDSVWAELKGLKEYFASDE